MMIALQNLVESEFFKRSIIALIILNAVVLGLETSTTIMASHADLLHAIDKIFLWIFVAELGLRMVAHRSAFWRDPWSLFDTLVVSVAFLPHGGEFAVLRTLRVLRVLRLISMIPSMRRVVTALVTSLSGVTAVAAIMLVIYYVFSVIATTLFREIEPQYFGTLGETMLTLFQVMTLEDWSEIARPIMAQMPYAWIFFVTYILSSTFVILNLFIGVMVYAIQQTSGQVGGIERRRMTPEQRAALQLLEQSNFIEEIKLLRAEIAELRQK
jgi:voltage-gated sodium channel